MFIYIYIYIYMYKYICLFIYEINVFKLVFELCVNFYAVINLFRVLCGS